MLALDPGWSSLGGVVVLVFGGALGKVWADRRHDRLASVAAEQAATVAAHTAKAAKDAADNIAEMIARELSTGNGHTVGMGISRLEERGFRLEQRLDRVEVIAAETHESLDKHIADVDTERRRYIADVMPVIDRIREDQASSKSQGG